MPEPAANVPGFAPESLVGATIDGRYRLTAHLATGGMGAVFRAEHVYMRKEVALKVLRPDLTTSIDIVERFRREAEIIASLTHENIVRVTDFGRSPDPYLFLVMELLEGESLFDRLRRAGPMSPSEALPILVQICAGLEAAHQLGVVHRDLKPENIFLHSVPGGSAVAKIVDFGIAKITDPHSRTPTREGTAVAAPEHLSPQRVLGAFTDLSGRTATQDGMVVGTPEYLSPEQAVGAVIDARADIYAVGLIAWRMLAGRHPFPAEEPRALLMMQATQPVPSLADARPELADFPALVGAVARACAKGASERHRTAGELRAELEASLAQLGGGTLPPPLVSPPIEGGDPTAMTASMAESLTPDFRPWPRRSLAARIALLRAAAWEDRRGRRALALAGLALLVLCGALLVRPWLAGRPAARAQQLIAAGRPEAARSFLEEAIARRPGDARLRALLGRALHRLPAQAPAELDAFEAAAARDPRALDGAALSDLAQDLSRERRLADRAAHLLAGAGARAVPAVLAAVEQGSGAARLRALEVARDLGAEDQVDRAGAYASLLADPDCEVRRAASRRLGEIGDASALARLRELAQGREETRGFLGITRSAPACGAGEAGAAARRIEAAAAHRR